MANPVGPDGAAFLPTVPDSRGPGLRCRFARVNGVTTKGVLSHALYLPVILGDFTFDEEFGHQDYDTIASGEFSAPQPGPVTARKLRTSDLDTLTIDWYAYARWIHNNRDSPSVVHQQILKIARSRTPFEILVTEQVGGPSDELRMKATIRSLSRTVRPGEADTRYMTLSIKEWRDNSVGRRRGAAVGRYSALPTKHKLIATDTLQSLSKKFYDPPISVVDGTRYIASANGIPSFAVTTHIAALQKFKVGDYVKIPKPPETVAKRDPTSTDDFGLG